MVNSEQYKGILKSVKHEKTSKLKNCIVSKALSHLPLLNPQYSNSASCLLVPLMISLPPCSAAGLRLTRYPMECGSPGFPSFTISKFAPYRTMRCYAKLFYLLHILSSKIVMCNLYSLFHCALTFIKIYKTLF